MPWLSAMASTPIELRATVAVAEIRECVTAVLVELQLCVLQLLLEVLLRRIHCKGELDNILAVLHLKRSFLYLQFCTCEGNQLWRALFSAHA